jgi:hypothetical protein
MSACSPGENDAEVDELIRPPLDALPPTHRLPSVDRGDGSRERSPERRRVETSVGRLDRSCAARLALGPRG